ncbi:MBL fold metallo-hydrolase [Desulfonatronum thiodismutans]|uniref:MBL fold metallo-hydrolase n=1 Tax=Desulfonatronum thiodismutans TaxID=159290 RepID=UPI0004ABE96C|nr:MBL fold metallo-hydrolase [Desulfonatronum thiodismutans]
MTSVHTFPLGPLQTNCYLVINGNEALVVDPGGAPDAVLNFAASKNLQIRLILNTHLHFDHLYGNQALHLATKAPIRVPEKDIPLLASGIGGGNYMGMPKVETFAYEPINEGELSLIGLECKVLATPGHSPGSLSFYFPELGAVFVGDVLFAGSIGRTDFFGGDLETLLGAVRSRLFTLPPETAVYPGHGPATSIQEEQRTNPFFEE